MKEAKKQASANIQDDQSAALGSPSSCANSFQPIGVNFRLTLYTARFSSLETNSYSEKQIWDLGSDTDSQVYIENKYTARLVQQFMLYTHLEQSHNVLIGIYKQSTTAQGTLPFDPHIARKRLRPACLAKPLDGRCPQRYRRIGGTHYIQSNQTIYQAIRNFNCNRKKNQNCFLKNVKNTWISNAIFD